MMVQSACQLLGEAAAWPLVQWIRGTVCRLGGWVMETWQTRDFVYKDERTVVQDAVRALLSEKPQLRLEVAVHRYRTEEISLAKAAALAGVSWERM